MCPDWPALWWGHSAKVQQISYPGSHKGRHGQGRAPKNLVMGTRLLEKDSHCPWKIGVERMNTFNV